MEEQLLLIFVKNPLPGKVKTRLAASLGNEKALEIYQQLLAYTRDIALKVDVAKEIWYGNEIPQADLWSEANFQRFRQPVEADLGGKMTAAFDQAYTKGYKKIVIIGSDNAKITDTHLKEAFTALDKHDVVIGPAVDGGYYLLGMRASSHFSHADIFKDKEWSTDTVFSDTVDSITSLGLRFSVLETLSDIDYEEDLRDTFLQSYIQSK